MRVVTWTDPRGVKRETRASVRTLVVRDRDEAVLHPPSRSLIDADRRPTGGVKERWDAVVRWSSLRNSLSR